jgi:hypothetical protein
MPMKISGTLTKQIAKKSSDSLDLADGLTDYIASDTKTIKEYVLLYKNFIGKLNAIVVLSTGDQLFRYNSKDKISKQIIQMRK